jgi:hypothetical protein
MKVSQDLISRIIRILMVVLIVFIILRVPSRFRFMIFEGGIPLLKREWRQRIKNSSLQRVVRSFISISLLKSSILSV